MGNNNLNESEFLDESQPFHNNKPLNKDGVKFFELVTHPQYGSFEASLGFEVHNASPELWQTPMARMNERKQIGVARDIEEMQETLNNESVCSLPSKEQWTIITTQCKKICGRDWPVRHDDTRVVNPGQSGTRIEKPMKLYEDVFKYYV